MTLIVEDGTQVIDADSYVSLADADEYLAERSQLASWMGVQAQGKLKIVAVPADGDTVVVGGKTYTFKTTLTDVDGYVAIGLTVVSSSVNLAAAFNLSGGAGYAASTTANPAVTASLAGWGTIIFTAIEPGILGNSVATTETFTAAGSVFDAAVLGTFRAGAEPPDDAQKERALRQAARHLDVRYSARFYGMRTEPTQAMQWPRSGVYSPDGYAIEDDIIPQQLIEAQIVAASKIIDGDLLDPDIESPGQQIYDRKKVGPLEVEKRWNNGGKGQTTVYTEIDRLMRDLVSSGSQVERG